MALAEKPRRGALLEDLPKAFFISVLFHAILLTLFSLPHNPIRQQLKVLDVELFQEGALQGGGGGGGELLAPQESPSQFQQAAPQETIPEQAVPEESPQPQPANPADNARPGNAGQGGSGSGGGEGSGTGPGSGSGAGPGSGSGSGGGTGDAPAKVVEIVPAVFPQSSIQQRSQGNTTVRILIGKDGRAVRTEVVASCGDPDLDRAAEEACMRSRFLPAIRKGQPEEEWVEVPFHFWVKEGTGEGQPPPDSQ